MGRFDLPTHSPIIKCHAWRRPAAAKLFAALVCAQAVSYAVTITILLKFCHVATQVLHKRALMLDRYLANSHSVESSFAYVYSYGTPVL